MLFELFFGIELTAFHEIPTTSGNTSNSGFYDLSNDDGNF